MLWGGQKRKRKKFPSVQSGNDTLLVCNHSLFIVSSKGKYNFPDHIPSANIIENQNIIYAFADLGP